MFAWKEKYSPNLIIKVVLKSLDQAGFRNGLNYAVVNLNHNEIWVKKILLPKKYIFIDS